MDKTMDFSIVKQKIILTDEVLRKYIENNNKLKKVQQCCKEIKMRHNQTTLNLTRLQLENERCTFNLNDVLSKKEKLENEMKILREQNLLLEEKYNKQVIDSQVNIQQLNDELKMFQELKELKISLGSSPKKKCECENDLSKEVAKLKKEANELRSQNMLLEEKYSNLRNESQIIVNKLQSKLNKKIPKTSKNKPNPNEYIKIETEKMGNSNFLNERKKLNTQIHLDKDCKDAGMVTLTKVKEIEMKSLEKQIGILTTTRDQLLKIQEENQTVKEKIFTGKKEMQDIGIQTETASQLSHIENKICKNSSLGSKEEIIKLNAKQKVYTKISCTQTEPVNNDIDLVDEILKEMSFFPTMLSPMRSSSYENLTDNEMSLSDSASIPNIIISSPTPIDNTMENECHETNLTMNIKYSEQQLDMMHSVETSVQTEIVDIDNINLDNKNKSLRVHDMNSSTFLKNCQNNKRRHKYRVPICAGNNNINLKRLCFRESQIKREQHISRKQKQKTKKLEPGDCILKALQTLKRSKINFTISNESTLTDPLTDYYWLNNCPTSDFNLSKFRNTSTLKPAVFNISKFKSKQYLTEKLTCSSSKLCNVGKSYMFLNSSQGVMELLGFFSVKNETVTPDYNEIENAVKSKYLISSNVFNKQLFDYRKTTPESLLQKLAELVSEKFKERDMCKQLYLEKLSPPQSNLKKKTSEIELLLEKPSCYNSKTNKLTQEEKHSLTCAASLDENNLTSRETIDKNVPSFCKSKKNCETVGKQIFGREEENIFKHSEKNAAGVTNNSDNVIVHNKIGAASTHLPVDRFYSYPKFVRRLSPGSFETNYQRNCYTLNEILTKNVLSEQVSTTAKSATKSCILTSSLPTNHKSLSDIDAENEVVSSNIMDAKQQLEHSHKSKKNKQNINENIQSYESRKINESHLKIVPESIIRTISNVLPFQDSIPTIQSKCIKLLRNNDSLYQKITSNIMDSVSNCLDPPTLGRDEKNAYSMSRSIPLSTKSKADNKNGKKIKTNEQTKFELVSSNILHYKNEIETVETLQKTNLGKSRSSSHSKNSEAKLKSELNRLCHIKINKNKFLDDKLTDCVRDKNNSTNIQSLYEDADNKHLSIKTTTAKKFECLSDNHHCNNQTIEQIEHPIFCQETVGNEPCRTDQTSVKFLQDFSCKVIKEPSQPNCIFDMKEQEEKHCNYEPTVNQSKKNIRRIQKNTKLKSSILRQVRAKMKMFHSHSTVESTVNNASTYNSDGNNKCGQKKISKYIDNFSKNTDNKKIHIVQNILIPANSSEPVDLLKKKEYANIEKPLNCDNFLECNEYYSKSPKDIKKPSLRKSKLTNGVNDNFIPIKKRRKMVSPAKEKNLEKNSGDILSLIIREMDKGKPVQKDLRSAKLKNAENDLPPNIEDKQWRKKIIDVADIINNHTKDTGSFALSCIEPLPKVPKNNRKLLMQPRKQRLLDMLLKLPNEADIPQSIVLEFKYQNLESIAEVILKRVSLDIYDKPDDKYYPAPLMTKTQRMFLAFMIRLEKENGGRVQDAYLSKAEIKLFRKGCGIRPMEPVTRLYMAICKLRADINRMRLFCGEAVYFMGDLAVPLLFTVLTSWTEVLPMESHLNSYPLAKVIVQVILLKSCNRPGYNLFPLKLLLNRFYGYPNEKWNCDEIFEELFNQYLRNPVNSTDFSIQLFCKNKDTKWVYKKMNEFFKPLIYKIPAENVNFKATAIILMGKICRQLKPINELDKICLSDLKRWLIGLIEGDADELIMQSVHFSLANLPQENDMKIVMNSSKNRNRRQRKKRKKYLNGKSLGKKQM